jgi:hypothetical protein
MYGYAVEPPIFPKPYPNIPPEEQEKYNKIKDKVT